jgi:hypothetical protein
MASLNKHAGPDEIARSDLRSRQMVGDNFSVLMDNWRMQAH